MAELVLFKILDKYRVVENREFFNCELEKIQLAFTEVEKTFKECDNDINIKHKYNINMGFICEMCCVFAHRKQLIDDHNKTHKHLINKNNYEKQQREIENIKKK